MSRRLLELATREFDGRALMGWVRHRFDVCLIGLGVLLRLLEYVGNRPLWFDEGSLRANIEGIPPWRAPGELSSVQLAPFGFLVIERALAWTFGKSPYVLRLFPILCGVISVPLFAAIARRCLRPSAYLVGLGLFALSDSLIYFSSELKPYSTDVAAVLGAWYLPIGLRKIRRPRIRFLTAAGVGAGLVWLSFPVALALGSVGLVALISSFRRRAVIDVVFWIATGTVWLFSFAGTWLVARRLLIDRVQMWAFWDFAFPPYGLDCVPWFIRRLLNAFANPMHIDTLFGEAASTWIGAGLAAIGALAMAQRRPGWAARLGLTLGLTLLAAALRFYPFHGRLILFLVPAFLLGMAEGVGWIGEFDPRRWVYRGLLVILFAWPVAQIPIRLIAPPIRLFSPLGDLRPNPYVEFDDPRPTPLGRQALEGLDR